MAASGAWGGWQVKPEEDAMGDWDGATIVQVITERLSELSEILAVEPACRRARWSAASYLSFLRSCGWSGTARLAPLREVEEPCVRLCLKDCGRCALYPMFDYDEPAAVRLRKRPRTFRRRRC
jgi:hypothetical protein